MSDDEADDCQGITNLLAAGDELMPDVVPGAIECQQQPPLTVELDFDPSREEEDDGSVNEEDDDDNVDDAPNMDVDIDITVHEEPTTTTTVSTAAGANGADDAEEIRQGFAQWLVQLEEILKRTRTNDEQWTHMVFWPDTSRHRIVNVEDAVALYRAWACTKIRRVMGIMERRISELTRASFIIRWKDGYGPVEQKDILLVSYHLQCFLQEKIARGCSSKDARLHAVVLLSPNSPLSAILHFPSIAISSSDISRTFCDMALKYVKREYPNSLPPLRIIICRNRRSCYPLYDGSVPALPTLSVDLPPLADQSDEEGETGLWTAKCWLAHPKLPRPSPHPPSSSLGHPMNSFPLVWPFSYMLHACKGPLSIASDCLHTARSSGDGRVVCRCS